MAFISKSENLTYVFNIVHEITFICIAYVGSVTLIFVAYASYMKVISNLRFADIADICIVYNLTFVGHMHALSSSRSVYFFS